ncbi:MAG: MepB family protein [Streptococcaceae bacterium]|jgi:hypothetical protein|nr:MepB family protein [Streptococcaceae bacterium]MCH4176164.1 MepB family protein [Streptococcaceae bacterium]
MKSLKLIEELAGSLKFFEIEQLIMEEQNREYEGMTFYLNNVQFRSRLAKLTPKKEGYFVVFWEKNTENKNQPYCCEMSPEKIIVSVIDNNFRGQFVFPKTVLLKQGVLSGVNSKGKMAIRVYPSWTDNLNISAKKTQQWQSDYFIDLSLEVNLERLEELYFL